VADRGAACSSRPTAASTWKRLEGHGLPHSPVGRIAVRVAKKDSNRVVMRKLKLATGVPQANSPGQIGQRGVLTDGGEKLGDGELGTGIWRATALLQRGPRLRRTMKNEVFFFSASFFANAGWRAHADQDGVESGRDNHEMWIDRRTGIAWRWSTMAREYFGWIAGFVEHVNHRHAIPVRRIDPHLVIVPPGFDAILVSVCPPSSVREKDAEKKNTSFSLSGANLGPRVVVRAPAQLPAEFTNSQFSPPSSERHSCPICRGCSPAERRRQFNFRIHALESFFASRTAILPTGGMRQPQCPPAASR